MRLFRRKHKHKLVYHGSWSGAEGGFERWHCEGCGHDFACLPTNWSNWVAPEHRIVSEHS